MVDADGELQLSAVELGLWKVIKERCREILRRK